MSVELISHWGNDWSVCDAARVSFNKHSSNYTEEQNIKLLNYLVEHKHTAPFRHPQLQFRITCPIYVERQVFKHQVGMSANSISGRYVDFSDSYTTIKEWRKQSKSSKQGSEDILNHFEQNECEMIEQNILDICKKGYDRLIELGVAKEQARTILPLNLNTTFIWTGSLLSFLHFFNLRLKPDTQKETREVANQMLECIKNIPGNPFKYTLEAWNLK